MFGGGKRVPDGAPGGRRPTFFLLFPDDFVDGVFFADGVHHLSNEEFEAAAFIGIDGVGDDDLIVEVFEGGFLFEGAVVAVRAFFGEGDNLESVAGDVLFAFGGDSFDQVVSILDDFPHERRIADVAATEFVVGVGGDAFGGIEALADRQNNAIGAQQIFKRSFIGCFCQC